MVNTKKVTPVLPVPRKKGEKKVKLVKDDVKGSSFGKGKGCTTKVSKMPIHGEENLKKIMGKADM